MYHISFQEPDDNIQYKILVVMPYPALRKKAVQDNYINPFGLNEKEILFIGFDTGGGKTIPANLAKQIVSDIESCATSFQIPTVYVVDSAIFKKLTGLKKSTEFLGIPVPPKSNSPFEVIYGINHQRLYYDPPLIDDLTRSFKAAIAVSEGDYLSAIPQDLSDKVTLVYSYEDAVQVLQKLYKEPKLSLDIETFSLKFYEAGLATFSFSIGTQQAFSFRCDIEEVDGKSVKVVNYKMRNLLMQFLKKYKGKIAYHNMSFDAKVLIYVLFMKEDLNDFKNLNYGLEVLTKDYDDTKLITYLAVNSTAGNELSLKRQAQEFAGKYGLGDSIKNVLNVPLKDLLIYNGIDALATNFVYEKNWPKMVEDQQLDIYDTIFKPSIKLFLQAELVGIPIDLDHVKKAEIILKEAEAKQYEIIMANPSVQKLIPLIQQQKTDAHNAKLKSKVIDISHYKDVTYNPNSTDQTAKLLFEIENLTYEDVTPTGKPSLGKDALIKIKALNQSAGQILEVIDALIELGEISIILDNFIKAFLDNSRERKGMGFFLFGSFNLGGTVSGRLSSSKPNLQNIPSNSKKNKYADIIKDCFRAPKGWIFCGADFLSLEDRISALTTKDPEKLKIYTDGFDGHCIRAYKYFSSQMPDIDPTSVESINSIEKKYKHLRQASKEPTFLLTYDGTWHGLVHNCGFTPEQAKEIENNYHDLYKVSDEWKANKIKEASKVGYVTVAFGLRVRTPLLGQTLLNSFKTPYEAKAEARTAGNALGQSYGMLNNRAGIEIQEKTLNSEYALDIFPSCHIHDAQYFLVRNNAKALAYLNSILIPAMKWQELEEIQHPLVKLGGELSVFYPSWKTEISIPPDADEDEIRKIAKGVSKP